MVKEPHASVDRNRLCVNPRSDVERNGADDVGLARHSGDGRCSNVGGRRGGGVEDGCVGDLGLLALGGVGHRCERGLEGLVGQLHGTEVATAATVSSPCYTKPYLSTDEMRSTYRDSRVWKSKGGSGGRSIGQKRLESSGLKRFPRDSCLRQ